MFSLCLQDLLLIRKVKLKIYFLEGFFIVCFKNKERAWLDIPRIR